MRALETLQRLCETGPWGATFERFTSSAVDTPLCLFVHPSGESEVTPITSLPRCRVGCRRVVAVSDTHGKHRLLRLPPGDVLVHAGDLLSRNACVLFNNSRSHARGQEALRDFNQWLGEQPHGSKVVVGGNHDATLELAEDPSAMLSNGVYLRDAYATVVGGLRFYGSPWSHGRSQNRAFQCEQPTLPPADGEPVDVLVSHCFHSALAAAARPSLYVSGHEHGSFGVLTPSEPFGGVAVNASSCDEVYRVGRHMPVVHDVAPRGGWGKNFLGPPVGPVGTTTTVAIVENETNLDHWTLGPRAHISRTRRRDTVTPYGAAVYSLGARRGVDGHIRYSLFRKGKQSR